MSCDYVMCNWARLEKNKAGIYMSLQPCVVGGKSVCLAPPTGASKFDKS